MATILLYSASISQNGTSTPSASVGGGKAEISGSWSRLNTGSYKFTRGSGSYFSPISASIYGSLIMSTLYQSPTISCSFSCYFSGSDSSSFYLNTYLPDNSNKLADNLLSSGSSLLINISTTYN